MEQTLDAYVSFILIYCSLTHILVIQRFTWSTKIKVWLSEGVFTVHEVCMFSHLWINFKKTTTTKNSNNNNTGHTTQESSRLISINFLYIFFFLMTIIYQTTNLQCEHQTVPLSKQDNDWWCFGDERWDCFMSSFSFPSFSTLSLSVSSPQGHTLASQTEGCLQAHFYVQ